MRVKQKCQASQLQKVKQIVKQNVKRSGRGMGKTTDLALKSGAGEGIRTLDVLLGKQALYH